MATKHQASEQSLLETAEAVRAACLRAPQDGYEIAGVGGLCEEGRLEMVFDSIKSLDVHAVVRELQDGAREDGSDSD